MGVYKIYLLLFFFFFNDTATTEIYTLSLHDALPIFEILNDRINSGSGGSIWFLLRGDRKSTRLNSSHGYISYAVFCLKKKKTINEEDETPRSGAVDRAAASARTP